MRTTRHRPVESLQSQLYPKLQVLTDKNPGLLTRAQRRGMN
jgi:hypothetical protein